MPFRVPVSNLLANEFLETFQLSEEVLDLLSFEWPISSKPCNQQRLEQAGRKNFGGRGGLVSSRLGQPVVDLER